MKGKKKVASGSPDAENSTQCLPRSRGNKAKEEHPKESRKNNKRKGKKGRKRQPGRGTFVKLENVTRSSLGPLVALCMIVHSSWVISLRLT